MVYRAEVTAGKVFRGRHELDHHYLVNLDRRLRSGGFAKSDCRIMAAPGSAPFLFRSRGRNNRPSSVGIETDAFKFRRGIWRHPKMVWAADFCDRRVDRRLRPPLFRRWPTLAWYNNLPGTIRLPGH